MPSTRILIYNWKGGYAQAQAIAEAIPKCYRISRVGSRYRWREGDLLINWGSSERPAVVADHPMLNDPSKVGKGKLAQYRIFKESSIPTVKWTERKEKAQEWLNNGGKVLGRDLNHGMGGHGIVVYKPGDVLGSHRFYVKYRRKERELRFHVFLGKVIFIQEKKRTKEAQVDPYIRSHGRGWCFAFRHLPNNPPPDDMELIAKKAVKALGLDFGAVDMGWNSDSGSFVFEVNTAPGIENTSLQAYVNTIKEL